MAARGGPVTARLLDVLAIAPLPVRHADGDAFLFGASVFFLELLPRLAARGHRVRVVPEQPALPPGTPVAPARAEVAGAPLPYLAGSATATAAEIAAVRRAAAARLDAAFATAVPDVVLLGRERLAALALAHCRSRGVPTLVVAHGSPTARLGDGDPALGRAFAADLARADALVAVAPYLAAILTRLGAPPTHVVPNGADPGRFRPAVADAALRAALGIAPRDVVVAHVSALAADKRPLDVVRSALRVLAAAPETLYLVVGDGPLRADMAALVRDAGIATRVRFVGAVPHADVPRHLALSDLVVLPSERHGVPLLAYREAQACALPVVTTDIPGARDAIVDGETGFLCPVGDVDALAGATLRLVRDPELRARLGRRARERSAAWSIDAWVDGYERALQDAAARR